MLYNERGFLFRILLPGLWLLAGCDTVVGKGVPDSPPVQALEAEEAGEPGNPFLGKDWINDEGFIYTFGLDGTIFVEHHCGLEFDNQFSYLIWKNILVIYGTEMDNTDTLKAGTIRTNGDSVIFTTTAHETIAYTAAADRPAAANGSPAVDSLFIGTWLAGDALCEFSSDGTLIQTGGGTSVEYSYLVRKDRLVTLSHEATPLLREYCFEKTGNTITVNPVGGGNPLIYSPYGK
jgi:hypothetical protein